MKKWKVLFAFALCLVLFMEMPASRAEGIKILELTPVLSQFRLDACVDPQKTFEQYADQKTSKRLGELAKTLCPVSDPQQGWTSFFGTSLSAVNSINKETILAFFYHPWSDVALITEWRKLKGKPKLTDAELVVGDVLRATEKIVPTPFWRREGKVPPPLEVLLAANDTVRDFLELYVDAHESKNSGNWRARLPNFKTKKQRETNKAVVGALFYQSLAAVKLFFNEKDFSPVKKEMDKVRKDLIAGKTDAVLRRAKETSKDSREILKKVELDWSQATLVSVVTDPKNTFVFLSSFGNPEFFASFWFVNGKKKKGLFGKAKPPFLKRIDLLGHTLTFEQLDEIAKKAGIAKK